MIRVKGVRANENRGKGQLGLGIISHGVVGRGVWHCSDVSWCMGEAVEVRGEKGGKRCLGYYLGSYELASTSLGGDSTVEAAYTIYKASQDAHASSDAGHDATETPFLLVRVFLLLAAAPTIPAGSSMDPTGQAAAAAPSSTIPAANKGKAPMVDDSLPADLLSEQEHILKNLHDYQLGEDLAKKLYVEQEAEFARQQEELAQKAQAERVASPAKQGTGLSDQRRRELDAAQLIYTEADWLELMAKIATNSALSKQLLGDDVNEENINERLGMLLMRKRRELAEQSWVKPMNKTQQRDYMWDFVKNQSAFVYNQGWTMKHVPASVLAGSSVVAAVSVPAAPSVATDVSVPAVSPDHAVDSVHVDTQVHADESNPDDTTTASKQVSAEHIVVASTHSSLRTQMVPSPLGSIHAYYDMEGHTKHFTFLHELLHMVEKNDLWRLLGAVDNLYQREEPDTFALLLWGDLHVLFQSLDDEDARDFRRNQDGWRIRSWHLYPRAQVHGLETIDGRVIYMFVDVSYPLSAATLQRMLKHGLEVPKLLVDGDLIMAE
uniref:Aminoacyl-tRNA synthetase, class 1a, anticodon-binding n=1 Tax=Tanacetum cinerariifolium TaxID=118510 RepID=A0A699HD67_TANCI|nr:aminoacyl-tRNA synthetase, class 1a, anticodon-binding [Tanacetum cinerariifolium]